jgi:hypothetical protein
VRIEPLIDPNRPVLTSSTVDFAKLPIGGKFVLGGKLYQLHSIGKERRTVTFLIDGKRTRMRVFSDKWIKFCRDVEGLVFMHNHGVDIGDLIQAVIEDPR